MKSRHGFVSNSSSSSFIVACQPDARVTATLMLDLHDLFEDTITTLAEFEAWIGDYAYDDWRETGYWKDIYARGKQALAEGKVLKVGTASNEGYETVSHIIYDQGLAKIKLSKGASVVMDSEN